MRSGALEEPVSFEDPWTLLHWKESLVDYSEAFRPPDKGLLDGAVVDVISTVSNLACRMLLAGLPPSQKAADRATCYYLQSVF